MNSCAKNYSMKVLIYFVTFCFFNVLCCNASAKVRLNVLDYGAIPNDAKDDTKAFQECISAARNLGKEIEVYVPLGKY